MCSLQKNPKTNANFLLGKRLGEDEAKSVTLVIFMKCELKNTNPDTWNSHTVHNSHDC